MEELGTKEIPGSKNSSRILEYHQTTGLKATEETVPWCGAFMAWIMIRSGIDIAAIQNEAAGAANWRNFGTEIKSRKNIPIGAIMVFAHHVTLFNGWADEAKTRFKALGGNQSNAVTADTVFQINKVLPGGIRWPKGIPLPVAQQTLPKSGVVQGSVVGGVATTVLISKEITDSTATVQAQVSAARDGFSAGDILGIIIGVIILLSLGFVIYSRIKGRIDAQKIENGEK